MSPAGTEDASPEGQRACPQRTQRMCPQRAQKARPQWVQRACPQRAQRTHPQRAQRAHPGRTQDEAGTPSSHPVCTRGLSELGVGTMGGLAKDAQWGDRVQIQRERCEGQGRTVVGRSDGGCFLRRSVWGHPSHRDINTTSPSPLALERIYIYGHTILLFFFPRFPAIQWFL